MSIEERLAALEAAVAALQGAAAAARPVNLDADKYADFTIRKCPPKWLDSGGRDYSGEPISTTTPEFCEAIAGFLDWQAEKDEAKNYSYVNAKGDTVFPAKFARKDAARARAWAVRLREKPAGEKAWTPPTARRAPAGAAAFDTYDNGVGDGEIPF